MMTMWQMMSLLKDLYSIYKWESLEYFIFISTNKLYKDWFQLNTGFPIFVRISIILFPNILTETISYLKFGASF